MCLYIFVGSFSVGLRLAKTTEICAKEGLCLSLLRSGLPSDFSAIAFRLAYRELYEWRGEAVRKLDHKYCHIVVRLCFCIRHVPSPIRGESFSVGLRLAKITEVRAKEGLCLSLLR